MHLLAIVQSVSPAWTTRFVVARSHSSDSIGLMPPGGNGSPFGAVLGSAVITDKEYTEIKTDLENTYGAHGLCFVFRNGEACFDGFGFEKVRP